MTFFFFPTGEKYTWHFITVQKRNIIKLLILCLWMSSSQLGVIFASLLASQIICNAQETFLLFTRRGLLTFSEQRSGVLQYLGQPPITKNVDSLPPCLLKVCIVCFLPFSYLISDACLIYSPTLSSELVSPPPTTLVLYFILSDVCVYYFL